MNFRHGISSTAPPENGDELMAAHLLFIFLTHRNSSSSLLLFSGAQMSLQYQQ
jgi:hypothetical protein